MPTITAAQHFFSSVPATQSPTGRRGYQTIACTPALPAEAVRAIEDRAQYATAAGDPIKRQFYALPGGLAAVSQIAPLAELDEFGRKGRYLAHTLVLDAVTFAGLEQCPLDVLAQFPFVTALDAIFRQIGPGKGQAPTVSFDVKPAWRERALIYAGFWPPDTLAALGRLAWRAADLAGRREAVILAGGEAEQLAMLGVAFLLAAPARRPRLSFDTAVAGCNFGPDVTFWVHGYAEPPTTGGKHLVDAHTGRINVTLAPGGDGPYAAWMLKDALPSGLAASLPKQPWAAALEEVLTTGKPLAAVAPDLAGVIPRAFCERFARLNAPAVIGRWLAFLPQGLSAGLTQALTDRLAPAPEEALRTLAAGLQPAMLAEFVFETLLLLRSVPAPADRRVLEPWIRASGHAALTSLLPFWAGDDKAWAESLAALPLADYEFTLGHLAQWPNPPLPLWRALPPPPRKPLLPLRALPREQEAPPDVARASAWLRAAATAVRPAEWGKVLEALAGQGAPVLDALADRLSELHPAAQGAIYDWLRGYRGEAGALRQALGLPLNRK